MSLDTGHATQVFNWMKSALEYGGFKDEAASLPAAITNQDDVSNALRDGQTLCKLLNSVKPGSVKKINNSKMAFKMMENIGFFLNGCMAYGCEQAYMFQTIDLYEAQNIPQVITGLAALGRKATKDGYGGPAMGAGI